MHDPLHGAAEAIRKLQRVDLGAAEAIRKLQRVDLGAAEAIRKLQRVDLGAAEKLQRAGEMRGPLDNQDDPEPMGFDSATGFEHV